MIALPRLRALLGAAVLFGPVLGALAAEPPSSAWDEGYPALHMPLRLLPCLAEEAAPMLLAAAAPSGTPATGTRATRGVQSLSPRFGSISGDITTDSDQMTSDMISGLTVLSGNVEVHLGDQQLQADRIVYDRTSDSFSASGAVRFHDPTLNMQGDAGTYSAAGAQLEHGQFQFIGYPGRGSAQQIVLSADRKLILRRVIYTSCPPPRTDWQVIARQLRLDRDAGVGVGVGAEVKFKGVPILYLPWISFPLSDARKSGFLFPDFGSSSRSGIMVGIPWYWNIAPNQDATFTVTDYSSRGVDLGTNYRVLSPSNSGTVNIEYLPSDRLYGNLNRDYVKVDDRLNLPDNTRVVTALANVSDTEYFEDFTQGTQSTSTAFLAREVLVEHRDDVWNMRAELLGFQTLDTTLPPSERPFAQQPRLTAAALWPAPFWQSLQLGFSSELVNFTREDAFTGLSGGGIYNAVCTDASACLQPAAPPPGPSGWSPRCSYAAECPQLILPPGLPPAAPGWRLDARPQIGLDLSGGGYFFRPSVAWEYTQYQLDDPWPGTTATGQLRTETEAAPTRSLPIVDIDTGLTFERMSSSSLPDITLEPRLMYVYIPYRNQSELPVFDTSIPDPNQIELFQPNRYVGLDRLGDANALTFGLSSQAFDSTSGTRYVSATVGQTYYFQQPRVALPPLAVTESSVTPASAPITGEVAGLGRTSGLIGEVDVTAYRNWNVQLTAASSPTVSSVEESAMVVQYRPSSSQVVNFAYRFFSGSVQQLDASTAWPVTHQWDLYARAVYSILGHSAIEDFVGFQYRGSCWGVRAVVQRSLTTRTGESDTGFSLQLELTGLSSVGSAVSTFLQQSIRGYSAGGHSVTTPATP
jgi:LPS-assembly protein